MIVIVRHGNTFAPGEPARRIGARTDLPLVGSGRAQAAALAAHFADVRFDRCLTSPLRRTRETAAAIVDQARVEIADWLREIDHGPDEDQPEAAVVARIGHATLDRWERDAEPPPGWVVDAEMRMAGWRRVLGDHDRRVLCVTSNGVARFALLAIGVPPAKLKTGAYGVLRRENDAWRVACWDVRPSEVEQPWTAGVE